MLINRNYARLWIGQTVSIVGDEVFSTTLLLWIGIVLLGGESYAPVVSSTVLIITSAIIILLGPVAGVFVDRWQPKRVMLRTDLIRAGASAALIAVAAFPSAFPLPLTLTLIGLVVAIDTAASQFFNPARIVIIKDIVPAEQQGRASSYNQTAAALATIIGPPLAAPLLVGIGVPWAITINAVSFLVSYLAIRAVRVDARPPAEAVSVGHDFRSGLGFVRRHRVVMAVLVTAFVVNLGIGAFNALDLYFVAENLHADPKWFGILSGAFGAGAVLGAISGGFLGDRVGHVSVVVSGLLGTGALLLVYSRLTSVWPAIPVITLVGFAVGALNAAIFPVVINSVPREFLGRVMAVIQPANRLGAILSISVSSVLVSTVLRGLDRTLAGLHFGRIDTVFIVASLFVAASGVYFAYAAAR